MTPATTNSHHQLLVVPGAVGALDFLVNVTGAAVGCPGHGRAVDVDLRDDLVDGRGRRRDRPQRPAASRMAGRVDWARGETTTGGRSDCTNVPAPVPTIGGRGAGLVVAARDWWSAVPARWSAPRWSSACGAGGRRRRRRGGRSWWSSSGGSGRLHGWRQIVPRSVGVPDARGHPWRVDPEVLGGRGRCPTTTATDRRCSGRSGRRCPGAGPGRSRIPRGRPGTSPGSTARARSCRRLRSGRSPPVRVLGVTATAHAAGNSPLPVTTRPVIEVGAPWTRLMSRLVCSLRPVGRRPASRPTGRWRRPRSARRSCDRGSSRSPG